MIQNINNKNNAMLHVISQTNHESSIMVFFYKYKMICRIFKLSSLEDILSSIIKSYILMEDKWFVYSIIDVLAVLTTKLVSGKLDAC